MDGQLQAVLLQRCAVGTKHPLRKVSLSAPTFRLNCQQAMFEYCISSCHLTPRQNMKNIMRKHEMHVETKFVMAKILSCVYVYIAKCTK